MKLRATHLLRVILLRNNFFYRKHVVFYIKKIFNFVLTLFLVTLVTFFAFQILPGNPAVAILGPDADEVQIANLEMELGLDKSPLIRYGEWIKKIFRGDFGTSYKYSKNVSQVVAEAFAATFSLAVFSLALSVLWGIVFGIFIALKERKTFAFAAQVLNQIWIATPSFCAAIFLIIIFCVKLRAFPSMGFVPWNKNPSACLHTLFLPALSMSLGSGAILSRYLKNSIQAEQKKDYVKTLRAKGLSLNQIIFCHVLRNSFLPALTMLGLLITDILGGSIIIENVFSIPGIGRLIATSISSRDFPLLQTLTLYLAFITVACNFLVDFLHSLADPRIRRGKK